MCKFCCNSLDQAIDEDFIDVDVVNRDFTISKYNGEYEPDFKHLEYENKYIYHCPFCGRDLSTVWE